MLSIEWQKQQYFSHTHFDWGWSHCEQTVVMRSPLRWERVLRTIVGQARARHKPLARRACQNAPISMAVSFGRPAEGKCWRTRRELDTVETQIVKAGKVSSMYPTDYRYTKDHQWVNVQGSTATIGVTAYAQEQLGDVIFVNLPKIGAALKIGEAYGEIESVKAVSDLYAPVSGEVAEVNTALADSPEIVNKDPHEAGWLVKIHFRDPQDISALMDASAYQQYTAEIAT